MSYLLMRKSTAEEKVIMIKALFFKSDVIKDSWLIKKFGQSEYLKKNT